MRSAGGGEPCRDGAVSHRRRTDGPTPVNVVGGAVRAHRRDRGRGARAEDAHRLGPSSQLLLYAVNEDPATPTPGASRSPRLRVQPLSSCRPARPSGSCTRRSRGPLELRRHCRSTRRGPRRRLARPALGRRPVGPYAVDASLVRRIPFRRRSASAATWSTDDSAHSARPHWPSGTDARRDRLALTTTTSPVVRRSQLYGGRRRYAAPGRNRFPCVRRRVRWTSPSSCRPAAS